MMIQTYVTNERGMVGMATIPDWLNFDEFPPRSFRVLWLSKDGAIYTGDASTKSTTPITKEVADILRSLK